jgi:hypothetical protein
MVLTSESEEDEFQMNFCQHDLITRITRSVKIESVFEWISILRAILYPSTYIVINNVSLSQPICEAK